MFVKFAFFALVATTALADSAGYVLPSSGSASATQFYFGPELSGGTACGMSALPNSASTSGKQGGGPGYLYAAINQLAFGANPSVTNAGGPGGACGICYELTPVSSSGTVLSSQALTFKIIDECPARKSLSGGDHYKQCTTSEVNDTGQHWHFDISIDAMSTSQYNAFFAGVTDGNNWNQVNFKQVGCGSANPTPPVKSWGVLVGVRIMRLLLFVRVRDFLREGSILRVERRGEGED